MNNKLHFNGVSPVKYPVEDCVSIQNVFDFVDFLVGTNSIYALGVLLIFGF